MDQIETPPRKRLWLLANWCSAGAAVVIAFAAGYVVRWGCTPAHVATTTQKASVEEPPQLWVCPMNGQHPYHSADKAGKCPYCGMDLVLAEPGAGADPRQLVVSEQAKALMAVETVPVERKFVTAEVRMVGKVEYDETKLAYITAWVPGRLDRLYVDYTGLPVKKGDHMVQLYSPELLTAQEELIQAAKAVKDLRPDDVAILRETAEATLRASREKLRLLGLTPQQIGEISKRGTAEDHVTINAPIGGVVVHKNARQGMYVKTGTQIYAIADLSNVWVKLDAYESDLMWLRPGQEVELATVSYPGEPFKGTIAFIDPILTEKTRTVKLRVEAPNPDGRLKPGMFVKAAVWAQVAAAGKVMDPRLAGKWFCTMHPWIIKAASGPCDICEMPLVLTESQGYVSAEPTEADKPLVIPITAALVTGKRAVVYVQLPGTAQPTFEGREVVLGPRAGDYYLVRSGLTQGELVVVKGNFKIDSALQIQAKPSMMAPQGQGAPAAGHEHGAHGGHSP